MRRIGDHAVVLGASLAGLLAARALADAYERVTVVERDVLPNNPENRRGVPQGRHAHLLLLRGTQILEGHPREAITYQASRPYLESQMRARARALPRSRSWIGARSSGWSPPRPGTG
jgi:glycine/D-amino acid oxidase-like deaminating enzyme